MSYVWKKLSENEKEQIQKDAKKLILEFGKRVEGLKEREEVFVERGGEVREETEECEKDSEFRELVLENAPKKNKDFIIAEKGDWIE
jgi:trimethylamine:corrinoid methyltransferase-like protein